MNNIWTYLLAFLIYIFPILAKSSLDSIINDKILSIIPDTTLKSYYYVTFPKLFMMAIINYWLL